MSEERVIRISKVLKEFNISLDRAVDTLKEKGHTIEHSPNAKVSQLEFDVLCNIFSADKGNKVASKEVGEEKKKEKEALKREIEKELEVKRLADEERQKQEIIKAKEVYKTVSRKKRISLSPDSNTLFNCSGAFEKNKIRMTHAVNKEISTLPISNCFLKLVEYTHSSTMHSMLAKTKYQ